MTNLISSKARLMVILRGVLGGLIVFMGLARLRIIFMLMASPTSYQQRDILQEYLMAKALVNGINPYLPLDQLAEQFIGKFPFLTHPAPYPPFIAIFSTPLLLFNVNQLIVAWFIIEILCLAAVAGMLTILWKGRLEWLRAGVIFFVLLCWYPVMVDLLFGQLTILLTTLLVAGLLAWRKERKILAGIFVGLSVALKMFTWPLIIYFGLKRDWRSFFSSAIAVIGLNLAAILALGFGPVSDYYLHVTMQVSAIYHAFLKNYSLWSIGYRFFEGTQPVGGSYISAPPLAKLPSLAPLVSAGLAAAFLIAGLVWAIKSKDKDIAYAIMLCVIVGVSPISWDHYYVIIAVSVAILLLSLARSNFPNQATVLFLIVAAMLFLFNEYISEAIFALNGGASILQANGNQISFASSLLETLPMVELVVLTGLLGWAGRKNPPAKSITQAT